MGNPSAPITAVLAKTVPFQTPSQIYNVRISEAEEQKSAFLTNSPGELGAL